MDGDDDVDEGDDDDIDDGIGRPRLPGNGGRSLDMFILIRLQPLY